MRQQSMRKSEPPQPLGIFSKYTRHRKELALKIDEKPSAGNNFDITDAASGTTIFRVNGRILSMRSRKDITDCRGEPLMTLSKKPWHIPPTLEAKEPDSAASLFTIKSSLGFGARLDITYHSIETGMDEQLRLKGDFFKRKAKITTDTGRVIGRISRKFFNAGELQIHRHSYILTVAPGVDAALLAALCVALDEKANVSPSN